MQIISKRYTALLTLTLLLFCSQAAFAGYTVHGDSLRVKWMDGKKYILHKVDVKENWTSISRRYKVTVDELMAANAGIKDLKIGQIIHVPLSTVVAETTTPAAEKPAEVIKTPVYYTVKHGETLYSVSKRFGMTVDEMRKLNRLDTDQLREGQQLVVKYIEKKTESASQTPAPANTAKAVVPVTNSQPEESAKNAAPAEEKQAAAQTNAAVPSAAAFEKPTKTVEPLRKSTGGKTLVQVTETGAASWIPDGGINQDKYYGLHRTAPIGTIIKVTNRMNNQSVYVKVVGVLPDTGDNENVIIKVSQAVASKLGALDPLFRAELSYGLMQ